MGVLQELVLRGLVASGVGAMVRRATRSQPRVLMYHGFSEDTEPVHGRVSRDVFRQHLLYIKQHFTPWKLSALIQHFSTTGSYPEGAVVITVDDGYENFHSIALPLLKEFEIPATVFVVAEAAEKNRWLWPDAVSYVFEHGPLQLGGSRSAKHLELVGRLKKMTPAARASALDELCKRHSVVLPAAPPPQYRVMTWLQIQEALGSGLVEVGGHSCTHPILAYLDPAESWYEIAGAKKIIEERLGIEVTSFCYPNGKPGDYTPEQRDLVRTAGYLCCVTTDEGLLEPDSHLFALPRIVGRTEYLRFRCAVDGITSGLRKCLPFQG